MLMTYLAVALGSALGGASRYALVRAVQERTRSAFPLGTLVVNVSGALLAGLLMGLLTAHVGADSTAQALLIIGFCGSYTTVSAFSLETLSLLQTGRRGLAALNVAASFLGSIAGVMGGLALIRLAVGGV